MLVQRKWNVQDIKPCQQSIFELERVDEKVKASQKKEKNSLCTCSEEQYLCNISFHR